MWLAKQAAMTRRPCVLAEQLAQDAADRSTPSGVWPGSSALVESASSRRTPSLGGDLADEAEVGDAARRPA